MYGVDYQYIYTDDKNYTVRVLLSLAANLDWSLKKFDVKNAFLRGDLEEEVYIDMPPGYGLSNNVRKVCRLRKTLYGLKQSSGAWFGRFTEAMKKYGYHQVTGDDVVEMGKLHKYLASEFEMKDLGALKYFLGIKNHHLAIYHDPVSTNKERYRSEEHLAAVMRILSYLKKAPGRGLIFRKLGHLDVKGYTDANWKVMELYCDNQAAREIANNLVQHDITKHLKWIRHYIKEKLVDKLIDIPFVKSEEQLADVLTHGVSAKVFYDSLDKLGI
ncbi:unnamed protein product [Prunus armeniaca]